MTSLTLILVRRELRCTFRHFGSWCILAAAAAAMSLPVFLRMLGNHYTGLADLFLLHIRCVLAVMPVYIALVTSRMFSEEAESGTLETLLAAPLSDHRILDAKFVTALLHAVALQTLAFLTVCAYCRYAAPQLFRPRDLLGLHVFLLFHAQLWISAGLLLAERIRPPFAAALATTLVAFAHAAPLSGMLPNLASHPFLASFRLSLLLGGEIDTRPIVFTASVSWLLFHAAVRGLERHRWRQTP